MLQSDVSVRAEDACGCGHDACFSGMPHFSKLGSLASSPWIDFTISRRAEFPGGREKCREFRRICPFLQKNVSKTSANSAVCERIPYAGNSLAALSRLRFCGKAGLAAVSGGVETNRFCFPWGFASPIGDRQTSLLRAAGDRAMSGGMRSANSVGVEMRLAVFPRGGRAARVDRRVRPRAVKRKAPRL